MHVYVHVYSSHRCPQGSTQDACADSVRFSDFRIDTLAMPPLSPRPPPVPCFPPPPQQPPLQPARVEVASSFGRYWTTLGRSSSHASSSPPEPARPLRPPSSASPAPIARQERLHAAPALSKSPYPPPLRAAPPPDLAHAAATTAMTAATAALQANLQAAPSLAPLQPPAWNAAGLECSGCQSWSSTAAAANEAPAGRLSSSSTGSPLHMISLGELTSLRTSPRFWLTYAALFPLVVIMGLLWSSRRRLARQASMLTAGAAAASGAGGVARGFSWGLLPTHQPHILS